MTHLHLVLFLSLCNPQNQEQHLAFPVVERCNARGSENQTHTFKSKKSKTCTIHFRSNQMCIFMARAVTLHPEAILQHAENIEQPRGWTALEMPTYFPALSILDAMHSNTSTWLKMGIVSFYGFMSSDWKQALPSAPSQCFVGQLGLTLTNVNTKPPLESLTLTVEHILPDMERANTIAR